MKLVGSDGKIASVNIGDWKLEHVEADIFYKGHYAMDTSEERFLDILLEGQVERCTL